MAKKKTEFEKGFERAERDIKKRNYETTVITIFIVMLIVAIGLYFTQNKFNPSTDNCDEWKCKFSNWKSDVEYEGKCNSFLGDGWQYKCSKWHPKNKCQLNPEAEGCVCDEIKYCQPSGYKRMSYNYKTELELLNHTEGNCEDYQWTFKLEKDIFTTRDLIVKSIMEKHYQLLSVQCRRDEYTSEEVECGCAKSHLPSTPIKIDLDNEKCVEHTNESIVIKETVTHNTCKELAIDYPFSRDVLLRNNIEPYYDKYCCMKKEKKNECEKGNPEYILDTNKTRVFINITQVIKADENLIIHWSKEYTDEEYKENFTHINESCNGNIHQFLSNVCSGYSDGKKYNYNCDSGCAIRNYQTPSYIENKFCRKKTISDLSCDELKNCYKSVKGLCAYINDENLLFEYIDRCGN